MSDPRKVQPQGEFVNRAVRVCQHSLKTMCILYPSVIKDNESGLNIIIQCVTVSLESKDKIVWLCAENENLKVKI